ncbi:unnamed protein product [Sphagnum jensenii]|uniref:Uncharacterized protein n=1 Tax=Sphagnum jensenii TaxID=128206 RepID=A0ABP1AEP3_9BRYO
MESSLLDDGARRFINEQPRWFTPTRLLILFCLIDMLNYLDQGVIASNGVNGAPAAPGCLEHEACYSGSGIQGDFKLSYFQDGVLSSAFMVGLVFPALCCCMNVHNKFNPFCLIGIGLSVWTFATAGYGFSFDFWSITTFHKLVGVGEASFISLAAPFIIDVAPPAQSSAWLALFYMFIPVEIALGYVFGGVVGGSLGWHSAFWIESLLMLPFAIFGLCQNEFISKGGLEVLQALAAEGYITYKFVLVAYAYWGPKAGQAIYNMENADLVFGMVTILSGILGTVVGGKFLETWYPQSGMVSSCSQYLWLWEQQDVYLHSCQEAWQSLFLSLLLASFFFLPLRCGPVNFVTLQSVTPVLRPLSMAISTVLIHIFGDVPSAPIVGAFQDWIQNWQMTALGITCIFFLIAAIWASGNQFHKLQWHRNPTRLNNSEFSIMSSNRREDPITCMHLILHKSQEIGLGDHETYKKEVLTPTPQEGQILCQLHKIPQDIDRYKALPHVLVNFF